MAVALIAQRHMDPKLVKKANAAAKVLSLAGPFPKSPDMVQLGPWADDLLESGLKTNFNWHFITAPYYPDADFTLELSPAQTVNAASVIPMLESAIRKTTATTEIITQCLAFMVHLFGDIHQPLHNANLFSDEYPLGDYGGNAQMVTIDSNGAKMLLHAYWDSMAEGPASVGYPWPLSKDAYEDLKAFVDYLEATYAGNLTTAEKNLQNTTAIRNEGYELAIKYAFPGASNGATLSNEYKTNAKKISERQVLLAGYRLAKMLNTTLKSVSMDTILQGLGNIQAEVMWLDNTTIVHTFQEKGLSTGLTVGIAIALFIAGVLISTVVVLFLNRPRLVRSDYQRCEPIALDL
ncbi:S1/P1 Nuclease family protein [Leishmania donovani]|uniref:3'-nucleotidase/nuclease, putative n=1 Tax=Leishmania donovani TaxID=5661 RepID=A0A3Q8IK90_LEIDO|nr:3'-nucleotidase/nuclease, putative [Leishmania donovani]TPP42533.1 S1/P1 Nuclease family protein [Leishmania donovani]